jgi:hypothetical protein
MENQTLIWIGLIIIALYFFWNRKEQFTKTCNTRVCNSKMKDFINNSWSFNNSSEQFKECNGCKSLWFRSSEFKTSEDGNTWEKHTNAKSAYNDIKL